MLAPLIYEPHEKWVLAACSLQNSYSNCPHRSYNHHQIIIIALYDFYRLVNVCPAQNDA
jgi:hypothetical protein